MLRRLFLGTLAVLWAGPAQAEEARTPFSLSPGVAVLAWAAVQLVPSPLLVYGSGDVYPGLRWQVTPLLYSFGIAARPFRSFLVSPIARHSGSVELYGSPELVGGAEGASPLVFRAGSRVYVPLVGRGESLSWSFGGSYFHASGCDSASAELGIYAYLGVLGLTVTVSPAFARREIITALNIRYF